MKKIFVLLFCFLCAAAVFAVVPANKLYEQKVNSVLFVQTQSATGSGIILKEDGTFVTCFHVIDNADFINVKTKSGKTYKVNGYKYLNPEDDIAILTINTKNKFIPVTMNNKINIGEKIYTIANPKGLQFVFSSGMINQLSNKDIQFSAPTSQGSSGGALLNESGALVGMITSQYNPSVAQNINFAVPNSYFAPHIDKKKKLNTKNLSWTDFVVSTLKENELARFMDYALETENRSMLYKYVTGMVSPDEIESERFALYGTMAVLSYVETYYNDYKLLQEALRWFALSVNSNKNVELSSYGLIFCSMLQRNIDNWDVYTSYLKKYPKTKKVLLNQIDELLECDPDNTQCINKSMYKMSVYLNNLSRKTYNLEE